jgi:tetratricopeptide (TPR) repeat protein
MTILGDVYTLQEKYSQADQVYRKALTLCEQRGDALVSDQGAQLLNSMGLSCRAQGMFSEAESLHMRALEVAEAAFEQDDGSDYVGECFNCLGRLYEAREDYASAEDYYKRELKRDSELHSDFPGEGLRNTCHHLGKFYQRRERFRKAEILLQRCYSLWMDWCGRDDGLYLIPSVLRLGSLYKDWGKHEEAEARYQKALKIGERYLGKDHPTVGECLIHMADLYKSQGKTDEAEALYNKALTIYERVFTGKHKKLKTLLKKIEP